MVTIGTKIKDTCPYCEKEKYEVEFKDGEFKEIKKAKFSSLMRKQSESSWLKDWRLGVAVFCNKCERVFFLYDINEEPPTLVKETSLREGLSVPWFCDSCRQAFISPSMICPSCNRQY